MTHVKQHKLLKDGIDPDNGEPVKSERWKNVFFTKCGKSYVGIMTWNSYEEALDANKRSLLSVGKLNEFGRIVTCITCIGGPVRTLEGTDSIYAKDYSHTIQLPVRT